jgi:hypothetical protein
MKQTINWLFSELGFRGVIDFLYSSFGYMANLKSLMLSLFLGTTLNKLVGLEPIIFATIIILFLLEIITGIVASTIIRKEDFDKEKLTRSIVKLVAYPVLLTIMHQLSAYEFISFSLSSYNVNVFVLCYNTITVLIVIQVLISFLENLSQLGFKELDIIVNLFKRKLDNIVQDSDSKNNNE